MKSKSNKIKRDFSGRVIQVTGYIFIAVFALSCLIPFIMMLSASFEEEKTLALEGYYLWPRNPSVEAYKAIFGPGSEIVGSFILTLILTAIGTCLGLFLTALTGYTLQRPDFKCRNAVSLFLYITTLL